VPLIDSLLVMMSFLHKYSPQRETKTRGPNFVNGLVVSQKVINLLYELVLMLSNLNRISIFSYYFFENFLFMM